MKRIGKIATLTALAFTALALGGCEDEATAPGVEKADLTMDLVNIEYSFKDGRHTYTHIRRFTETAGLGVVLEKGRVCVHNGEECAEALVKYRIEPGAGLDQPNHYVATKLLTDATTIEYTGKNDNGNPVRVFRTMKVNDKTTTVE